MSSKWYQKKYIIQDKNMLSISMSKWHVYKIFVYTYNIKYQTKIHVKHMELEGIIILEWIQC